MFLKKVLIFIIIIVGVGWPSSTLWAQLGNRPNLQGSSNMDQRDPFSQNPNDTTENKVKKKDGEEWDEEPAVISYKYLNSEVEHYYDTTLTFFHRNQDKKPYWYNDLGNWGSPARASIFTIQNTPGLRLGYDIWDAYSYTLDSVHFIHTTRPYTSFSFMLGAKQLQWVDFMHTQNINPRWNFAFRFSNNVSDGFFRTQKASGLNGFITTNYKSEDERHDLKIAFIVNNFKNDENGGIQSDSLLSINEFSNRSQIPVNIQSMRNTISHVHNRMTQVQLFVQNSYAWGKKDTLYNADSTQFSYKFTPRFSIKHVLDINSNRHIYRDGQPDTNLYLFKEPLQFGANDTLRSRQSVMTVDNRFSLNTFLGKDSQLVHVEAGLGFRYDQFKTYIFNDNDTSNGNLGTYLFGQIRKDAIKDNQWSYLADGIFYFTGSAIGNLKLDGNISKQFPKIGAFTLGLTQSIVAPSYQQSLLRNNFFQITNDFGNTTNTQLYGKLWVKALKLELSLKNQLISNYIYLNDSLYYQQHSSVFSILQFSGRKFLQFGAFSLDNEVVWQQLAGDAPVNLPSFMLRHQLSYKLPLFKDRLEAYLGVEARYHTPYKADGYSPVYNQFYYQNNINLNNVPALAAFFNFKVKRLRAFVMGDQLQQLFYTKNIIMAPGYPAPDTHIRFGFNWLMMN